jgi:hypothetical protein
MASPSLIQSDPTPYNKPLIALSLFHPEDQAKWLRRCTAIRSIVKMPLSGFFASTVESDLTGYNIILIRSWESGKTTLARRLPTILPPMLDGFAALIEL